MLCRNNSSLSALPVQHSTRTNTSLLEMTAIQRLNSSFSSNTTSSSPTAGPAELEDAEAPNVPFTFTTATDEEGTRR